MDRAKVVDSNPIPQENLSLSLSPSSSPCNIAHNSRHLPACRLCKAGGVKKLSESSGRKREEKITREDPFFFYYFSILSWVIFALFIPKVEVINAPLCALMKV